MALSCTLTYLSIFLVTSFVLVCALPQPFSSPFLPPLVCSICPSSMDSSRWNASPGLACLSSLQLLPRLWVSTAGSGHDDLDRILVLLLERVGRVTLVLLLEVGRPECRANLVRDCPRGV